MQKILLEYNNYPQKHSTECERYEGVQTYIGITENNFVEVQLTNESLMEEILSPCNLNKAYKQVKRNKGAAGVDRMELSNLLPYLQQHKDELINSLYKGNYKPNPVRRVEIPKEGGKTRPLGIPTVVDRLIQQAISQVLTRIYDSSFNDNSCGFRPKRGCHDALQRVQKHVDEGYKYAVDLDLEKFFDTVNHSKLIEILSRTIQDHRLISLIHKYLNAGVMMNHVFTETKEGVPQGGNLSPILSNIMLNELDKELIRRGHRFVRYADDCMILCKSKRAAQRVKTSIVEYIENQLFLKVNKEKTEVGYIRGLKFLGYTFYIMRGKCRLSVHSKSTTKMKAKLKELTSRSNGMGYEQRKEQLTLYIQGWINYYKLADMKQHLHRVDKWYRRRLRMCIWKCWKKIKTRFKNLMKCGIEKQKAWEWANTRKGYWHISNSWILATSITNEKLWLAGYPNLSDYYRKLYRN